MTLQGFSHCLATHLLDGCPGLARLGGLAFFWGGIFFKGRGFPDPWIWRIGPCLEKVSKKYSDPSSGGEINGDLTMAQSVKNHLKQINPRIRLGDY